MKKLVKKHSSKLGLPPGTLVHIGSSKTKTADITVIDYDRENFSKSVLTDISQCGQFAEKPTVTWLNIDGLSQVEVIEKTGKIFDLHPLTLEDILNTDQRPKFEVFEKYVFVVLKMLTFDESDRSINAEQISFVLGQNFVISFQERKGDVFDPLRQRLEQAKGKIRAMESDYLLYCLVDMVVDNYFLILEKSDDIIESLQEELIKNPSQETFSKIHSIKRELILLRRAVWPLREVLNNLKKSESELIADSTEIYFSDVYDHTIQIIDTIESLRDIAGGMIDMYLSSLSNRMNAVMKVLAIIATIFMPLSFLAGIYGMNFDYFPEIHQKWMYPFGFWGIIIVAIGVMLYLFKRKKWL